MRDKRIVRGLRGGGFRRNRARGRQIAGAVGGVAPVDGVERLEDRELRNREGPGDYRGVRADAALSNRTAGETNRVERKGVPGGDDVVGRGLAQGEDERIMIGIGGLQNESARLVLDERKGLVDR